MNCAEVESLLDLLAHSSQGGDELAQGELHKHLAICPACRQTLELIERWDSRIRPVMSQVAIPVGLTQRLTDALQDPIPEQTISNVTAATNNRANNRWKSRIRTFAIIGIVGLFAVSLRWSQQYLPQPMLTTANVASLWEQLDGQSPSPSTVEARLPRGWSSLTHVRTQPWQQAALPGDRLNIPIKRLEIRAKRGPSEDGWLLVIPKSRWGVSPLTPISAARVQYLPPRVWIAWNEGDNVYVLAVTGSPQSLEQIQRQLELNNSVL